jgi:hypothetical protein
MFRNAAREGIQRRHAAGNDFWRDDLRVALIGILAAPKPTSMARAVSPPQDAHGYPGRAPRVGG